MSQDNPFSILGQPQNKNAQEVNTVDHAEDIQSKIKDLLGKHDVILFMKGNPDFPQCGFSANSVQIINKTGVNFFTYDILQDPQMRQGLKEYSNWPTFPQLYVKGELIGGNDILTQMAQTGELQQLFN